MDTSTSQGLDQSTLNNLIGGSGGGSLIPESLVTLLTVSFIVLNVLGLLFVAAYITNAIRNWKVQSAVFHMQKDLAEVKATLLTAAPAATAPIQPPATPHATPAQAPPQPGDSNRAIASADDRPLNSEA